MKKKEFVSFEEARKFARKLKLSGLKGWNKWCATDTKPDIPKSPDSTYKNSGWVSWGDFLGIEKAKKFVRNLKKND